VLLLHPAEAMNLQAASALLKTLEEPPGQARLLLSAADEARLLPTVRSRCQRIRLAGPSAEMAISWLTEQGVRDAPVLLAAAGGAPLAARDLAAGGIDAAAWLALPRAVARGQAAALAGWPVPRAVDALQKVCHDALVQAAGGVPRYFSAQALPAGARPGSLNAWAQSLSRVARHAEHPWNEGLLVEALVSEGRTCWQEATTRGPRGARALDTLGR
jgi:DNA polymerase III subunit delta'